MPVVEVWQLDQQHRRLQLVEPEVAADHRVVVLRLHAVHAQLLQPRRQRLVVGRAQPAVAEGTQVLGREEREAADVAEAADPPAAPVLGADRLRRVLDDPQPEARGQFRDRVHVGGLAVEVHRHDGLDAAAGDPVDQLTVAGLAQRLEELTEPEGLEVVGDRVDVEVDRARAGAGDRPAGGEEGVGTGEDLVTRPDVERHQRHEQRVGARRDADAVLRPAVGRDLLLQLAHGGTEDEHLRLGDVQHGCIELGLEGAVLGLEVEQRDVELLGAVHGRYPAGPGVKRQPGIVPPRDRPGKGGAT